MRQLTPEVGVVRVCLLTFFHPGAYVGGRYLIRKTSSLQQQQRSDHLEGQRSASRLAGVDTVTPQRAYERRQHFESME